jgi:hypothetical protein
VNYHIEYAKYKYGYVTIVGWLIGDTPETNTALQVQSKKGEPIEAQISRVTREDIRKTFFPEGEENQYGFRVRFQTEKDKESILILQGGNRQAKCRINPVHILRTSTILDGWKETVRMSLHRTKKAGVRAEDGATNLSAGLPNPYEDAEKLPGCTTQVEATRQTEENPHHLFSILVPLYQTNHEYLLDLLESVMYQSYQNWELCLADGSPRSIREDCEKAASLHDGKVNTIETRVTEIFQDPRVKYRHLEKNLGISGNTNQALELVTGEYVVMVDHDDLLNLDALLLAEEWLERKPDTDFLYSDSDLTDQDHLYDYNPLYKPDWSMEMLYSANYITHLSVIRTSLLRELGGFREEYDGAQDWDLFLRIGEQTNRIEHIPGILYHWRAAAGSTALAVEEKPYARQAQLRAVQDHLDRVGIPGRAKFVDEHSTCIRVCFSNKVAGIHLVTAPGIELSEEAEKELCNWAAVPGIGIVGCRRMKPDGTIGSQGMLLQRHSRGMVLYAGAKPGTADSLGHTDWYRNDLIPDTACYAISEAVAAKIGMPRMDGGEGAMAEWFIQMKENGYRSLITPFVEVS